MGCCESRDKGDFSQKSKKDNASFIEVYQSAPIAIRSDLLAEATILGLRSLLDEDVEAMARYLYIEELEHTRSWESVKESSWYKISKITGTKFNDFFPVSKIWFTLGTRIDLSTILEYINDPVTRLKWDKNFKTYEVIDGNFQTNYVIYYLVSIFAYKADYIEKKVVATYKDTIVIVYYSVENSKKPRQSGISRGKTFIGLTRIKLIHDKIEFEIFGQSDPDSALANLAVNIGVRKSDEWCKKYKDAVLATKKNNNSEISVPEEKNTV